MPWLFSEPSSQYLTNIKVIQNHVSLEGSFTSGKMSPCMADPRWRRAWSSLELSATPPEGARSKPSREQESSGALWSCRPLSGHPPSSLKWARCVLISLGRWRHVTFQKRLLRKPTASQASEPSLLLKYNTSNSFRVKREKKKPYAKFSILEVLIILGFIHLEFFSFKFMREGRQI